MRSVNALKGVATFLFFLGLAVMIPRLSIEFVNFESYSLQVKMLFVLSAGILGIAALLKSLAEVSKRR